MICKLLVPLFALTFMALSVNKIEAKNHHHSRSNVRMHVSAGVAQPTYYIQPAPVVVHQQPVIVQTTPVATYSQQYIAPTYVTPTYVAPTYVVQQPVIVQPRQQPSFNWGFANWGFSIRL